MVDGLKEIEGAELVSSSLSYRKLIDEHTLSINYKHWCRNKFTHMNVNILGWRFRIGKTINM